MLLDIKNIYPFPNYKMCTNLLMRCKNMCAKHDSPIATPVMNRPKHKHVISVDNPITIQPIKNGMDVN